jgi:tetratricopeptide (TPR) repeat protein
MKFLSCVLLLTLAVVLVSAPLVNAQSSASSSPTPSNGVADLVKHGRQLSSDGKQDEAIALYTKALQQDPNSYQAELGMGMALDLKGQYADARQHLEKAIQDTPEDSKVQPLRAMAVSYAFERDANAAARYEQQAYEWQVGKQKFTDAAGTANELARIYLESGDLDNAHKWYQKGYETAFRDPKLSESDKNLWLFRWENAQARIAARRGPAAEAQQHVSAAKAALEKANNPDQARFVPYLTGYVSYYAGDYSKAIADLQQGDQTDPAVLVLEAQAYDKSGDQAKGMELYRKVLTINAHSPANAFARPLAEEKVGTAAKS